VRRARSAEARARTRRAAARDHAGRPAGVVVSIAAITARSASAAFFASAAPWVRAMPSSTARTRASSSGLGWLAPRCAQVIAAARRRTVASFRPWSGSTSMSPSSGPGPGVSPASAHGLSAEAAARRPRRVGRRRVRRLRGCRHPASVGGEPSAGLAGRGRPGCGRLHHVAEPPGREARSPAGWLISTVSLYTPAPYPPRASPGREPSAALGSRP